MIDLLLEIIAETAQDAPLIAFLSIAMLDLRKQLIECQRRSQEVLDRLLAHLDIDG